MSIKLHDDNVEEIYVNFESIGRVYANNTLVWIKGGTNFSATPDSFTFGPEASTGHELIFIYRSPRTLTTTDITLPPWATFVSLVSTGNAERTMTVLTFDVNINTGLERIGDIITIFDMGSPINRQLTQTAALQVRAAQFVSNGATQLVEELLAQDVNISGSGTPLDLINYGEGGAQFRLGPVLNTGYGGVRVPRVTMASFASGGTDTDPGDGAVGSFNQGTLNLQTNSLDRNDDTPAVGLDNVGRNLYVGQTDGTGLIFIGKISPDTIGNVGNLARIRVTGQDGTTTQTFVDSVLNNVNPGDRLWLADDLDDGLSTSFFGVVPITLDSGARVNDGTIHTINPDGRLRIGLQGVPGDDTATPLTIMLNPVNAVSEQANVTPVNGVDRVSELRGTMGTSVESPLPGSAFPLVVTSTGHNQGDAITFNLFSDAARTTALIPTPITQTGATWNPVVAIEGGTFGAVRETIFYASITSGGETFPAAGSGDTLQIVVESRLLRFTASGGSPDAWNDEMYPITITATGPSATAGNDPTINWNINQFSFLADNTVTSGFGVSAPTIIGSTALSVNITTPSVNHSPVNTIGYSVTARYNYSSAFQGLTNTGIVLIQSIAATHPLRPRVPMTVIESASPTLFASDFNSSVQTRIISDSGDQVATSLLTVSSQYPTIDLNSTELWIEDTEQSPTNAVLDADTTNQASELFNTVLSLTLIQELETTSPNIFGPSGDRSLLPYVRAYTITQMTHDQTDTIDDSGAGIGALSTGRNVTGIERVSNMVILCNDRPSS